MCHNTNRISLMPKILLFLFSSLLFLGCNNPSFDPDWVTEQAPAVFSARFETTKGDFDIEVERERSPAAADRLFQLIKHGYYDNAIFYRVVPQYIAQFGNSDTAAMSRWRSIKIPDEPVKSGNVKGSLAFARYGKDSRDLELFINLNDNAELDTTTVDGVKGYPAFGRVAKGMDVVESLYSGYSERSMAAACNMYANRADFVRTFPNLDLIRKAYLLEKD